MGVYWAGGVTPEKDLEKIEEKFINFRADVVGDMLAVAKALTPDKSGKTKGSWGAGPAKLRSKRFGHGTDGEWRAHGPAQARAFLRTIKVGDGVFAGNSWFVSGFFEKGTDQRSKDKNSATKKWRAARIRGGANTGRVKARRMLQRGIEAVKDRKV